MALKRKGVICLRRFSTVVSNDIYILSAVRTLTGVPAQYKTPQLCSLVLKEALQRGIVPVEDVHNIFMTSPVENEFDEGLFKQIETIAGLRKGVKLNAVFENGLRGFIEASQLLLKGEERVCAAAGLLSKTLGDSTIRQDNRFIKAYESGAFDDEIVIFPRKDFQDKMKQSEAAAVVLATEEYIRENQLTSLGKVLMIADESSLVDITKKILQEIELGDINQWVFCSGRPTSIHIDASKLAKDSCCSTGLSGICHLVHSLSEEQLGCTVDYGAVVIKKLPERVFSTPELTLYTKHPCPLCDELKNRLEPFKHRFNLTEIDIEDKTNEKLRKLFRYDIPVLFLNGRFLCKHRVDLNHFEGRLRKCEKPFSSPFKNQK